MAQLAHDIHATLIQPRTGQEIEDCTLEAGRLYERLEGFTINPVTEQEHCTIEVDGYLYHVLADNLQERDA